MRKSIFSSVALAMLTTLAAGQQVTFKGKVEGITGNVGLDVFRGTKEELLRFIEFEVLPDVDRRQDWTPPGELGLPELDFSGPVEPYGRAVERLQGLLMSHGYGPSGLVSDDGLPSGLGGPLTRDALGRFQRDAGLPQDYKVGRQTWWALIAKGMPEP